MTQTRYVLYVVVNVRQEEDPRTGLLATAGAREARESAKSQFQRLLRKIQATVSQPLSNFTTLRTDQTSCVFLRNIRKAPVYPGRGCASLDGSF